MSEQRSEPAQSQTQETAVECRCCAQAGKLNEACVRYEHALEDIRFHASGECPHTFDEHLVCFAAIEKLARAALDAQDDVLTCVHGKTEFEACHEGGCSRRGNVQKTSGDSYPVRPAQATTEGSIVTLGSERDARASCRSPLADRAPGESADQRRERAQEIIPSVTWDTPCDDRRCSLAVELAALRKVAEAARKYRDAHTFAFSPEGDALCEALEALESSSKESRP